MDTIAMTDFSRSRLAAVIVPARAGGAGAARERGAIPRDRT
jgi:hypothetical protein